MMTILLAWLKGLPQEFIVMIIAALPITELRGAIPLGLYLGMPAMKVFLFSIIGNMIPVAPILFLFKPISQQMRKFKFLAGFFDWLIKRSEKNSQAIQKYEALGLLIFVAIPLPMTGAWSGAIAAAVLTMRFRYAFWGIFGGVLGAGLIILMLCQMGILGYNAVLQ
jgi:uncharacterized membrane protein